MRAVVQRVLRASVSAGGSVVGEIDRGLLVFLGVRVTDTPVEAERLATKIAALRLFEDSSGKTNLPLREVGGHVLCISQFTLYGTVRRGNRPSFDEAARGAVAGPLYRLFCESIERSGVRCETGIFGADMLVSLTNDGPVTLMLDTADLDAPRRA